jgi:hypothetical protein
MELLALPALPLLLLLMPGPGRLLPI